MKNIRVSNLSADEILELAELQEDLILSINTNGIPTENAKALNTILKSNLFQVDLSTDNYNSSNDNLCGLEIIKYIPNVKRLRMQGSMRCPIESLDMLSEIEDLEDIDIYGEMSRALLLDPLRTSLSLEKISLEVGLSLRQQTFIESSCSCLNTLQVADFNARSFNKNLSIKTLKITSNIMGLDSMYRALPTLESLYLKKCSNTSGYSSIKDIRTLKKIVLENIANIDEIPGLHLMNDLETLYLYNLPKINDLKPLLLAKNLKNLILSDVGTFSSEDFNILEKIETLENVGLYFKNTRESSQAIKFIKQNKWNLIS